MFNLKGEIREPRTKLAGMRAHGFIPGVYYGHKEKATPCAFPLGDFKKIWKEAGESTIVVLEMPKGKINALIQEVQVDPVRGTPTHVDFYVIEKGQEVEIKIPLEFIGVSDAVKSLGATLVKVLHEIEIKALPENLPHKAVVDISTLATLDDRIIAKDIIFGKGVTLVTHENEVVALVAVAKEEEIEEAAPVDLSTIEVEKKGKKEEGEEITEEKQQTTIKKSA
ncbi:MAG: 50S ribosomal protein L25 [Candidatus Yonathbacteria bacterium]|nr:50S ribosomal protein L25 [Candidatus Yonathbacteria bacterium]